ncbi:MAG: TonB-dependent receptor, partial [Pseudomonadota bacterium]
LPFAGTAGDIIPTVERFSINGFADYDITPEISAFLEVKFNRTEATLQNAADFALASEPFSPDNPFIPAAIVDQFNTLDAISGVTGIDPTITLSFTTAGQPGLNLPEITERETTRIVGGFRGEVKSWLNYEVSANYGRTEVEIFDTGTLLPDRLQASLDVVTGPDGQPTCASTLDPTATSPVTFLDTPPGFTTFTPGPDSICVPFNLFAPVSADVTEFLLTPTASNAVIEQAVLNATFTGSTEDFFALPGGPIGYAAGIEYRDERTAFQPDALLALDLGPVPVSPAIAGDFDVIEGFAEINLPLLGDLPFVEALNFDASVRVADYSTVGTTASFAFGLLYQPVDDLRVRGSFNRSVGAPNLGELFAPQSVSLSSFTTIEDPCDASQIELGENRAANCAAQLPEMP